MTIKLNEYGLAIANNPNEFYREFPDLQLARVTHACLLASMGYKLDPRRADLLIQHGLGKVANA